MNKSTIKLIKSLAHKKNRMKEQLFLVEGDKNVAEVIRSGIIIEKIFGTRSFIASLQNEGTLHPVTEVSRTDIGRASLLKTPQNSLALCRIPEDSPLPQQIRGLNIYLDGIQDPGNLGTILRICDWFGLQRVFCSPDTADVYNPKVIQASMGSFCRVKVIKTAFRNLARVAEKNNTIVYGAFLEGENLYQTEFGNNALMVLGNEGNGIRAETEQYIAERISIPSFSNNPDHAESLNVSVATAIICSEFMRRRL